MAIRRLKSGLYLFIGKEEYGALTLSQCIALFFLEVDDLDKLQYIRAAMRSRKDILKEYGI